MRAGVLALAPQRLEYAPGGRLYSRTGDDVDVGTWRIRPDARLCRNWNASDGRRERCYVVRPKGDAWELDNPERFTWFILRRAPGE